MCVYASFKSSKNICNRALVIGIYVEGDDVFGIPFIISKVFYSFSKTFYCKSKVFYSE